MGKEDWVLVSPCREEYRLSLYPLESKLHRVLSHRFNHVANMLVPLKSDQLDPFCDVIPVNSGGEGNFFELLQHALHFDIVNGPTWSNIRHRGNQTA